MPDEHFVCDVDGLVHDEGGQGSNEITEDKHVDVDIDQETFVPVHQVQLSEEVGDVGNWESLPVTSHPVREGPKRRVPAHHI